MTNHKNAVYKENETKLPWPIELSLISDENQIGQQCDRSYRYALRWNQNSTIWTYLTECGKWRKPKRTSSYYDA